MTDEPLAHPADDPVGKRVVVGLREQADAAHRLGRVRAAGKETVLRRKQRQAGPDRMKAGTGVPRFGEERPVSLLGGDGMPRPVRMAAPCYPQRRQGAREPFPGHLQGKGKADGLPQPHLSVEEGEPMHGLTAVVRQAGDFPFDIHGRGRTSRWKWFAQRRAAHSTER